MRIQITIALIAFMLLRLAHETNKIVESPLAFAKLIRANLMQRRTIADLLRRCRHQNSRSSSPSSTSGRTFRGWPREKSKSHAGQQWA